VPKGVVQAAQLRVHVGMECWGGAGMRGVLRAGRWALVEGEELGVKVMDGGDERRLPEYS
jgi:hypothetical protein